MGVIFLLLIALIDRLGGYFYWAQNIEAVKLTKADLDLGGSYSAEERQELSSPRARSSRSRGRESCSCLADKAATDMSRFERLALIAASRRPEQVVALIKGRPTAASRKTDR